MWKSLIFRCLRKGDFALPKVSYSNRFICSSASVRCNWSSKGNDDPSSQSHTSSKLPQNRESKSVLDPVLPELTDIINSFSTTEELLRFLQTNPTLRTIHYLPIFQIICKLQKNGTLGDQLTKDPFFEKLCREVKKNVRHLNGTELMGIFNALSLLNVSSNSSLSQNLLQMISKNVNKLTIQQLIFLQFLLGQCSPSPLVEALKIAVPVVFETIIRLQLHKEHPDRVYQAFIFAFSESSISKETRAFLVNAAHHVCDQFSTLQAQRMSVLLCKVNETSPEQISLYKYLMDNVAEFMTNHLKISDVNILLGACVGAYVHKSELYFHDKFMENAMQFAIDHNASILQVGNLLRNFSRLSYPCYTLIDYLDQKLASSDFEKVGSIEPFLGFLSCCSNCSYKPRLWHSYKERFIELIDNHKTDPIPLLRVVTDLVVMKCWVSSLIEYCFREDFLSNYLKRENSMIDYLTLLRLYQVVHTIYPGGYKHTLPSRSLIEEAAKIELNRTDFPLEGALSYAVGGCKYVLSGVNTQYGHFIDHLVVRQKSGKMAVINENELKGNSGIRLESLELPEESLIIGVLLLTPASYCLDGMKIRGQVKLKIHSLEALGVAVVPISKFGFASLLDREKIPYLANKIDSRTFARNLDLNDVTVT